MSIFDNLEIDISKFSKVLTKSGCKGCHFYTESNNKCFLNQRLEDNWVCVTKEGSFIFKLNVSKILKNL